MAALLVIVLLCLYSYRNPPTHTLDRCLEQPALCDHQPLSTSAGSTVETVDANGFWLRSDSHHIWVEGDSSQVHPGDTVFLEAVFHQEGYLELQQIYVSRYRKVRIWVSLLAIVWVIWVFLRTYRFDLVRRVLVPRS